MRWRPAGPGGCAAECCLDVARPGGTAGLCVVRGQLLADSAHHAGTPCRMRFGLDPGGPVSGPFTGRVAGLRNLPGNRLTVERPLGSRVELWLSVRSGAAGVAC